ncbi:MAG: PAS domain S-box protein [Candidatus Edwardsbacteria bacterium]|nr:PAS domain S-box protein [Candidatus Edwardsbacteria bacterium]MBU1577121.1 PAS domain S-box protein [Candidatus Edwardsbacteria bacterium]MBU2463801.1 PAS domain S-box protein [Candidatus Edwardsbacteria bacterium]MBU2593783.1 PAS domain S-box protein [Candidatus Edwardsbacteria bacterium]
MSEPIKILILEDVPSDAELVQHELRRAGLLFNAVRTDTKEGFVDQLERYRPDIILSDWRLPSFDGLSALEVVKKLSPDTPFIIVSGSIGEEQAVEAIKRGASDYIIKDRMPKLGSAIERALQEASERKQLKQGRDLLTAKNLELETARSQIDDALQTSERSRMALLSVLEDQKQTEETLRHSQDRYRTLIESQRDLITRWLPDTTLTFVNQNYCDFIGKGQEELLGKSWIFLLPVEERDKVKIDYQELAQNPRINEYEHQTTAADGTLRWTAWSEVPILDKSGNLMEFQSVGRDITRIKQFEMQIRESLKEKEVLLKEIHHRVKNNLQIIVSLLNLQTGYVDDPRYKKMFMESQNRVRSMALVHEKLYKSKDLAGIDFSDYVGGLMNDLYSTYGSTQDQVELTTDILKEKLPIDIAIPCGLIINELASNSFKYAFKSGKGKGRIGISLVKDKSDIYTLEVSDDGPGISADLDLKNSPTLGLQLVDSLVGQLDASIKITGKGGTRVTIKFKAQS